MSEFKRQHDNGTWIKQTHEGETRLGVITGFDPEDGMYYVTSPDDWDNPNDSNWEGSWSDGPIEIVTQPNAAPAHPEHIFVLLYRDESDNETVEVFADPESVVAHLPANAPSEVGDSLQLKLMEAVADPGEWQVLSTDPGFAISFRSVTGAER